MKTATLVLALALLGGCTGTYLHRAFLTRAQIHPDMPREAPLTLPLPR